MRIVFSLAIVANILSIIILLTGLIYNFKQPKNKAIFGYSVVGSLLAYIVFLGFVVIYWSFSKLDLYCFVLALCTISPFVIGKLVRYETLKKYTVLQIMFFSISLITLILK